MSGIVDYGETYSSDYFEVTDAAGDLANAGAVTATITLPDGTTVAASVDNPAVGQYTFDYLTTQAGLHSYVVEATGGILGTLVRRWTDSFDVDDETPLISVRAALSHMRIREGDLTSAELREQLRGFCLAATSSVSLALGRVLTRRTVTETLDGGRAALVLRSTPVASITTVEENGVAVTAGGYQLPLATIGGSLTGKLYRGGTTSRLPWAYGFQNVAVEYVAGLAALNTAEAHQALRVVRKVCLNTVQGMWQSVQQGSDIGEDDAAAFAAGTLTPGERAAYEALKPVTGFA